MTFAFITNTRSEILKCRNSAALWLTIGGAAFIPIVNTIKCVAKPEYFLPKFQQDPWSTWLDHNWQIASGFFLTMYVICVTSLVVQIEFRSNGWKQLFASPRSFADIYFSKVLTIFMIVAGCFALFNIFLILSGYITGILNSGYGFSNHEIPWESVLGVAMKMFMSVLSMTAIQYILSLRFKNFIIPMGIGLGLFTTGFMIRQWELIDYYPYMHPFLVYFKNPGLPSDSGNDALMHSAVGCILVLAAGYINMLTWKERG